MPLIVRLLATAAVADDRLPAADRTSTRQLRQADLSYPSSVLSSVHGSAIKRINGWREGPPLVSPPSSIRRLAFTLLHGPVSNEKRMTASWMRRQRIHSLRLAGF
jgi:hypothetical protein